MTDLNEIAVFVSVAQLGSFTGAARALRCQCRRSAGGLPISNNSSRDTDTADDAKAHIDGARTRLLRSMQRAARAPLRCRTRADPQPAPARGHPAHLRAGDPRRSGFFLAFFPTSCATIAHPPRPVHHEPDARPRAESIDVALRIGESRAQASSHANLAPPCGTSSPRRPISPPRAAPRAGGASRARVRAAQCRQQRGRVGAGE